MNTVSAILTWIGLLAMLLDALSNKRAKRRFLNLLTRLWLILSQKRWSLYIRKILIYTHSMFKTLFGKRLISLKSLTVVACALVILYSIIAILLFTIFVSQLYSEHISLARSDKYIESALSLRFDEQKHNRPDLASELNYARIRLEHQSPSSRRVHATFAIGKIVLIYSAITIIISVVSTHSSVMVTRYLIKRAILKRRNIALFCTIDVVLAIFLSIAATAVIALSLIHLSRYPHIVFYNPDSPTDYFVTALHFYFVWEALLMTHSTIAYPTFVVELLNNVGAQIGPDAILIITQFNNIGRGLIQVFYFEITKITLLETLRNWCVVINIVPTACYLLLAIIALALYGLDAIGSFVRVAIEWLCARDRGPLLAIGAATTFIAQLINFLF